VFNTVDQDLQGKPLRVPRSIVMPSLKSSLVLVALAAMVTFGFGRLGEIPADLSLKAEIPAAEMEQIITAAIEQDVLNDPPSMSPLDSGSVPELSSGWMPPSKRVVPARVRRSPRRGGPRSPMAASWLHSTLRPEKQLPAPANARSATSGMPVAVFTVLRN